ncbi:MAG: hypothetical protein M9888_04860 [Chitinophagales bacterium]|nr:hypothetical protein [Chitinophagales bacterium]
MMNPVYISNISAKNEKVAEIVFAKKNGIEQLFEKVIDTSGDTVFVIDVHCTFKGVEKMLQQGGVIIYRHLLKQFEKCQDKLKVVFYSPISKDDLVRLKPENYVLKLLPFVECKYEDGQFERELHQIILDNKFPQFNNASENLLSGWALANSDNLRNKLSLSNIDTKNNKIFFIDDQQSEWKLVLQTIFINADSMIFYVKNTSGKPIKTNADYRIHLKNNWNYFEQELKKKIKNITPDLILSDFYLTENHESNEWKDIPKIKSISGYKVFDFLKKEFPSVPYVFHSSSNKTSIYKFFDSLGVDDWMVKDIRVDALNEQKLSHFEIFKNGIEGFCHTAIYKQLNAIWKEVESLPDKAKGKGWEDNYIKNKEEIISILKSAWFAIRRLLNREIIFEQKHLNLNEYYSDSFTSTSVCNNIGKILELLKLKNGGNEAISFVFEVRNQASHHACFNDFSISDATLAMQIFFISLEGSIKIVDFDKNFHKKVKNQNGKTSYTSYPFSLLLLYINFYNCLENNSGKDNWLTTLEKRVVLLFNKYKDNSDFKSLLFNKVFKANSIVCEGVNSKSPLKLIFENRKVSILNE